jgi:hypothetical protein
MDRLIKNKKIVKEVFEEVLAFIPKNAAIEILPVVDETNGHFMIYSDGWEGTYRDYACFFHLQVMKSGIVYIRHDGTNLDIANELVQKGIPKSEILLAFHAPYKRKISGFAVV